MKTLFLVIASNNSEHLLDEATQRETWTYNQSEGVIWLRGAESTYFDAGSSTLFVSINEKYENILEKTLLGMKWCLYNLEFDFLVRANVSTYFDVSKVNESLYVYRSHSMFIGGHIDFMKIPNSRTEPFVNGGAIFMNKRSVLELQEMDISSWLSVPDDFAISKYFVEKGAKLTSLPRGNISNTGIIRYRMYYRLKSSENGAMASLRMKLLHKILTTDSAWLKTIYITQFYVQEIRNFRCNFKNPIRYLLSVYSTISSSVRARMISKVA
jgi:hypothetical protein